MSKKKDKNELTAEIIRNATAYRLEIPSFHFLLEDDEYRIGARVEVNFWDYAEAAETEIPDFSIAIHGDLDESIKNTEQLLLVLKKLKAADPRSIGDLARIFDGEN